MPPITTSAASGARSLWPAACLAAAAASLAAAQAPLRYCFAPGDHLLYERRATVSTLTDPQVSQRIVDQIQVWCFDEQRDEALLLLDLTRTVSRRGEPVRGVLVHVDQRGRRRMPDVSQTRMGRMDAALEIIPVLRLPMQDEPVWRTPPDWRGLCRRCTLVGPDPARAGHLRVDFVAEYPHDVGDALGRNQVGRYWFDPRAGLVTRVESLCEDRHADRRVQAVAILRQHTRHPDGWAGRAAADVRRYQQTLRYEDRLLAEVVEQPQQVEQTLERLRRLWAGSGAELGRRSGSPFRPLVRARREQLATEALRLRAEARYARRWLNRPAVPWSLQDPAGETRTSEEFRTGVGVECLWSTETPGFFATLAALREVQPQLAERGVRIICLNMDADVPRARGVIERLPAGLTHVLAGPLRAVDQPPRLPVLRVLDRGGVIRRLWIGRQPSHAAVVEEVQRWAE